MNKVMKIFLSVMIVSLSSLIFPLIVHGKNSETDSMATQENVLEYAENQGESITEISINFEIDAAIEEMNQKITEIDSIKDKKEWFIAYKNIINEYSYIIDLPETIYDCFTEEELDFLFHVVQAEVGDEYSFEQKSNVANVIFCRLAHERFPNTLSEILTPDQFQPIGDERYKTVEVSENTILACEYAFQIGTDADGCLFFDSNNTLNYKFVFNDDAHNFYKYKGD